MAPMFEETQEIPPVPDMEEVFFEDPNTTDLSAAVFHPEVKAVSEAVEIEEVRESEEPPEEEQERAPVYEEERTDSAGTGDFKAAEGCDASDGFCRTEIRF